MAAEAIRRTYGESRCRAQGRKPAGLDLDTAKLFPKEFVDSDLGDIPKGFAVRPLGEVAEVIMGQSPPGDTYNTDGRGTPLINGPVQYGERFPVRALWTVADRLKLSRDGDLIFCVRGSTTGRRVVADGTYALGRGVCAIRAKCDDHQQFVVWAVEHYLPDLLAKTTGSVFPNLSSDDIADHPIAMPSSDLFLRFGRFAGETAKRVRQLQIESATLTETRDALLPKLLSGEMRLRDARQFVEGRG